MTQRGEWAALEGGYAHVHMTKPQTLAVALNDSPAGLAAWIAEKFRAWSDCDGDVARRFSHEALLTGISLYWFTGCIGSSMQMYWENRLQPMRFAAGQRVAVPVAFARFPKSAVRRAAGSNACSTSCNGPTCRAAVISRRWKSRIGWPTIFGRFSGAFGDDRGGRRRAPAAIRSTGSAGATRIVTRRSRPR